MGRDCDRVSLHQRRLIQQAMTGLFFGNPSLLMNQLISIGAAWVYSFVITLIILKALDATMGLRVDDQGEFVGLDHAQHGESGYTL